MIKFLTKDNFINIIIIFISIFFSISYSFEQYAVDGGLVISGIVKYPEDYSVLKAFYFNQWTFMYQFSAFFLKLNLSILSVSRLILFFSTLFFFVGIYLSVKSISSSSILSFFIALTVMIFRKNFGDIDYPTLIFSEHTNGMMSLGIVTFIFGLIANRNLFLAGFFSIFLICIHLVVGLWITSVLFFTIFVIKIFTKNFIIKEKIFHGMLFAFIPVLFSFIYFYINTVEIIPSYDKEAFKTWMELWEAHRTNYGNISLLHYEYIAKSLLLVLTCILGLKYYTKKITPECQLMLFTVLISCFGSIIIYTFYKLNSNLFPDLLTRIIPTRFALMHSVIGIPIIISFLFLFIKELLIKNKINQIYAFIFILFALLVYSVSHYKNILTRTDQFILNIVDDNKKEEKNMFWQKVKKAKLEGFVLTTRETSYPTLRLGLKPVLLHTGAALDMIPYMPYTANRIKEIVEKVYDVPFDNPPIKNMAEIYDDVVKVNFEKKTYDKWQQIFNEFRISALIVPTNWKIDLKFNFKNDDYAFYKIVE